jgi:site-specific DNA-methyltransferase (adenine-specific)
MANIKACMSSKNDEWGTPTLLFRYLDDIWLFNLDACAKNAKVALCPHYISPETDALKVPWTSNNKMEHRGRVFMNPPFSHLREFCARALEQVTLGNALFVVALLPARTDTRAFHESIYGKAEITFLRGRLTFEGAPGPAPFPSMICVWRKPW